MAEVVEAAAPVVVEAEVEVPDADKIVRIGKRCFVGNLAWRTSWQDLKDAFRVHGNVVYANVMRDEEGRSKGWGIVEFESPEEVRRRGRRRAVRTPAGKKEGGREPWQGG